MKFIPTDFPEVWIIEFLPVFDERGFFARVYCKEEFKKHGIELNVVQTSYAFNKEKATLRGLHFQVGPFSEKKLVCCVKGCIYDVVVDMRDKSPTRWKWFATCLSEDNRRLLYIPEGFAHGYETLKDNTVVLYQISEYYRPEAARGLRWDDPVLNIPWPLPPAVISPRDRNHKLINAG